MSTVELYRKVRLACADGMSKRAAARHFNISRDTVDKVMAFSVPPGYRRTAPIKRPKLDGFTEIIDGWLEGDLEIHRKQRHTAKRVFERLRDEHGFTGGYTIVKDYMRQRERRGREMFVPLSHPPGHAQADFGEATVIIGGIEQTAHFFVMDLPHSDACYVRAYPAATAEAWVDGHVHAFAFFGKVPVSTLYDNDRCLVSKILPDGTRQRATLFSGFLSPYLFHDRYGRPGKGRDKGNAEGLVGLSRRSFMMPIPRFATRDAFNDETLSAIGPRTMVECWKNSASNVRRTSCAASLRPSVNASRGIWPRCPNSHAAVKQSLKLAAVGFDAVKHLVLCQVEKRPPKLDLDVYPYMPRANVETTSAASYMALMTEATE